ncbi:MAG: hypothetical protein EHM24_10150 [Acidobacteria bacterium]|nr:MAG: hypothetical protein EHM24_10150 [Acidobacteriota bacterium]
MTRLKPSKRERYRVAIEDIRLRAGRRPKPTNGWVHRMAHDGRQDGEALHAINSPSAGETRSG